MGDDKTIKIVLKDGGLSPQENPPVDSDALNRAKEDAKRVREALETFQVGTEPFENVEKVGKRRGRPPKDEDPDSPTPDEPTEKKKKTFLLKSLESLQKVVTALEGVNGRATKGLAVLHRAVKAYSGVQVKQTAVVAAGSKALGSVGAAAAAASKVLGGVTIGAAALTAAFFIATVAGKAFSRLIESLQDVVKSFSGALNVAKARTEVALVQSGIRAANKVGGEAADLEETNRQIKTELIALKTEFLRLMEPFVKAAGETLVKILQFITKIFEVLNAIQDYISAGLAKIAGLLSHLPVIGGAMKDFQKWLVSEEIKGTGMTDPLNKQVEALFQPDNVNFRRNSPNRRFLP